MDIQLNNNIIRLYGELYASALLHKVEGYYRKIEGYYYVITSKLYPNIKKCKGFRQKNTPTKSAVNICAIGRLFTTYFIIYKS